MEMNVEQPPRLFKHRLESLCYRFFLLILKLKLGSRIKCGGHGGPPHQILNAAAAQAVDVAGVEDAKIPVALGAMVYIGLQAGVALPLGGDPASPRLLGRAQAVSLLKMPEDFPPAFFPVPAPMRSLAALVTCGAVS